MYAVPDSALTISVIVEGELVAGESIILNCIASKSNEVGANPRLIWIRPNGEAIQNDTHNLLLGELEANGTRSSLPLTFPALRTSTAGEYMCLAALSSPALSKPLMETSVSNVTIQSESQSSEVMHYPHFLYIHACIRRSIC